MVLKNIYVDIKTGSLERKELPRFAAYMFFKNLAWICFFMILLAGIVFVIVR